MSSDDEGLDLDRLRAAAEEAGFLCARGYPAAAVAAFVAEHRRLGAAETAILDASARAEANHRHHIARELDAEDVARRALRIDVASLVETLSAALLARGGARIRLLESTAGLVMPAGALPPLRPEVVDEALDRIAAELVSLRPSALKFVCEPTDRALMAALHARFAKRAKLRLESEEVTSVADRLDGAGFVVSTAPGVVDRAGTWFNLAAPLVRALDVRPLRLG